MIGHSDEHSSYDTFKVDVEDNGKEYLIEAEMPGVDKKTSIFNLMMEN